VTSIDFARDCCLSKCEGSFRRVPDLELGDPRHQGSNEFPRNAPNGEEAATFLEPWTWLKRERRGLTFEAGTAREPNV